MTNRAKLSLLVLCLVVGGLGTFAWLQSKPTPPPLKPTAAQLTTAFPEDSRSLFRESERFILYRLTGSAFQIEGGDDVAFNGYEIVGKTVIRDKATQQKLINAYEEGLADTNFSAACFYPRHGIRVEKGKQQLDLVICFSCSLVQVLFKKHKPYVHIGKQPEATFDAVLAEMGVPETEK